MPINIKTHLRIVGTTTYIRSWQISDARLLQVYLQLANKWHLLTRSILIVGSQRVNDFISKSFENISPVKYQVNKTKVDELASSSVRYHKKKIEEVLNSVTENYLNRVPPGQDKKILGNFN